MDVQYAVATAGLPTPDDFRNWSIAALEERRPRAQLTVRIVDREEGAELSRRYRHREGATNVLAFPFEPPPGVPAELLGDIVICAPVVEEQAREQNKELRAHWAHMVVHGILHLLGYDHRDEEEAAEMEKIERTLLERLGCPDPYRADEE